MGRVGQVGRQSRRTVLLTWMRCRLVAERSAAPHTCVLGAVQHQVCVFWARCSYKCVYWMRWSRQEQLSAWSGLEIPAPTGNGAKNPPPTGPTPSLLR